MPRPVAVWFNTIAPPCPRDEEAMPNEFVGSLSLLDTSGQLIIAVIILLLLSSLGSTWSIRRRYAILDRELRDHSKPGQPFGSRVLARIVTDTQEASDRALGEVNVQAIVEHRFQSDLASLMIGERFVKASTGLAIILGLVGTFYGLTSSIGKLVGLVAGGSSSTMDVTQAVTGGLTQALSGMSVAFSTSLFGILSAIIITLVGVFFSVADCRTRVMAQVEAYVEHMVLGTLTTAVPSRSDGAGPRGAPEGGANRLALVVGDLAKSVGRLEESIAVFDSALVQFAANTRDFQEFNLHLKDNIQRMSLAFGDFSDTLKAQSLTVKSRL